jgi:hypothetical protein
MLQVADFPLYKCITTHPRTVRSTCSHERDRSPQSPPGRSQRLPEREKFRCPDRYMPRTIRPRRDWKDGRAQIRGTRRASSRYENVTEILGDVKTMLAGSAM